MMVVIVLEQVPTSLRGELTRWLLEVRTGVFAGNLTAMVRDRLWEKIGSDARGGAALLIHSADTEQGFAMRVHRGGTYAVVDFEGLQLIART